MEFQSAVHSAPSIFAPLSALDGRMDHGHQTNEPANTNMRGGHARTIFHQARSDNDTLDSTRSLYDSDVVYMTLHGRRYCGQYYMPNDEDEQTRLQILHDIHLHLFKGKLTMAPLYHPRKILDIGTGTGEWAMAIGDEYPEAEVIGTDIARIQPSAVPLNVFFEIDDAEEEGGWTYAENEFDLIHFRYMVGAFTDWNHIYTEAYKHLKPGGWVEIIDFDDHKNLLNYFSEDSGVPEWMRKLREGLTKLGRPRSTTHLTPSALTDLGFVDIKTMEFDIPMGTWPDDPEAQNIGKLFLITQLCGAEALCLRVFVEQLGMDVEEIKFLIDKITESCRVLATDNARAHGLCFKVKVLIGRKPGAPDIGPAGMGINTDFLSAEYDNDGESVSTTTNASVNEGS